MPWTPNPVEEKQLKFQIKTKFPKAEDEVFKLLCKAKGKKQAEAVLAAAVSVKNIKDIAEYGFELLQSNDATKIKSAFVSAPAEIAKRKAARASQDQLNMHIEGYLSLISAKYKAHQNGEFVQLPVMYDSQQQMAVKYQNGEQVLPPVQGGIYIEWYPFNGSTRSPHKRFFTHSGGSTIWYTEGGTHGNLEQWWVRDYAGGDWEKKPA